jgi:diguanylate cyclase (GGDEF)-like protein
MGQGTARGRGPQDGAPVESADPRLAVRAFCALWGVAVALAWVWIALTGGSGPSHTALIVLAAIATVGATTAPFLADRLSRAARPAVFLGGVAIASAGVALSGGLTSDFALFYVWMAAWSAAFLPRRAALFGLAAIAVGYGVAIAAHGVDAADVQGRSLALWILRIGTVAAMAGLVAGLGQAIARRERALRRRDAQQEAVAELGVQAMTDEDVSALTARAVASLARCLEVPRAAYVEQDPVRRTFTPRAVRGWPAEELAAGRPVPVDGAPASVRPLIALGTVAFRSAHAQAGGAGNQPGALSVPVRGREETYGILSAHDLEPRSFSREDVDFALGLAGVLGAAIERHAAEAALRHQSMHDPLTGAPNRALFFDRLSHAVARARRTRTRLGVLYLDLDGFKGINDSFGHQAGDTLLVALAPRLREAVRSSDTVARLGGDEFAVLCEDVAGVTEAQEVAARLLAAINRPVPWGRTELRVSASVGLSVSEPGLVDPDVLVRDADAALYRAKARGRGRFEVWDDTLRSGAEARRRTQAALRQAIEADALGVAFEPVVELSTETLVGAEALVRWSHADGTAVPPREFLAVAEEGGLIGALGAAVLRRACRAAATWPEDTWVAVNISPRQLLAPDIQKVIETALESTGLAPERLHVELTETAVLGDAEDLHPALARLKTLGVRLVLDDFGTGHASLAQLRRHPIDAVKIDRSFIGPLPDAASERAIVRAVVGLAASLGFELIAEGVERPVQAAALQALGCEIAQGWLYGRECTEQDIGDLARIRPGPRLRAARAR